ncbi:MAG: HD-GYP domain-containing protein [Acetomicrobium sp.]
MLKAKKIPVSDLEKFKGIVAEDVVSKAKALILPRGSNLSWLSSVAKKNLIAKLKAEGIEYISVYSSDVDLQNNFFSQGAEYKEKLDVPVKRIDRELANQTMKQIGDLYQRIASGEDARDLYESLIVTGHILTQEILQSDAITLSLIKVREKDEYTYVHSFNVALLAGFLAARLSRRDKKLVEKITIGGLVHDIGKALIPLEILNKPGRLDDREYAIMKAHPVDGFNLARQNGIEDLVILSIIRWHHERVDGKGYPDGLTRDAIPLVARIAAVADVFDAVTTDRVYRTAESPYNAISLIIMGANTHFDPEVARELILALGLYPPGTVVELSNQSTAVVIASNHGDMIRPVVMVLSDFNGVFLEEEHVINLKQAPGLYIKGVIGNFNE